MAEDTIRKRTAHERTRYYLTYTGLFLVVLFFVLLCFLIYDRQLLWSPDGLAYYSKWKELGSRSLFAGSFSFEQGLGRGGQNLAVISAFFYPVLLLTYIWPADQFETLYALRALIGFYLAGISFSIFARKFSKNTLPVLAGAMVYIFSGYMLKYGCRHLFFTENIVISLPLILLGIERILRGESGAVLTAAVFYQAVESAYFLYMAAILAAIYFAVRFFTIETAGEKRSPALFAVRLGRAIGAAVLGVLMGAVTLVPNLWDMLRGGRIGNTRSFPDLLYSDTTKYGDLTGYFFAAERHYVQGFPAVVFPAAFMLFAGKGARGRRSLRWFWIVGLICLCLPIFGFVCSGFSNVTDRWGIGITLTAAMIVILFLARAEALTTARLLICTLCFAAYAAVCLVLRDGVTVRVALGSIAVTLAVLFVLRLIPLETAKKIGKPVLLVLTCVSLCLNGFMLYSPVGDDYQASFVQRGEVEATYMSNSLEGLSAYLEEHEDDGFFRVAANDTASETIQAQLAYDLNGIAEFNSLDMSYMNYLLENDNVGLEYVPSKLGMDNRTAMMELAGVKYYSAPAETRYAVPYGYVPADTVQTKSGTYDIYVNEYALPLGYAYGSYITREEYESMQVLDRQNALMQAVLLEEDTALIPHGDGLSVTSVRNRILSAEYDNVTWEDGVLNVGKGGGSITYTVEPVQGELYVHVTGMHMVEGSGRWTVSADTETAHAYTYYRGDEYTYYTGADRLLNLGYTDEPVKTVTVSFTRRGPFPLESIDILTQPMDEYAVQAEALSAESLQNVTVRGDTITGDITVQGSRVLCLAIPYSSVGGWTAYVDGQKTELFRANSFYMGLGLSEGEHSIRLEYRSPLVLECGIVSAVSAALFIGFQIRAARRRRRAGQP